MKLLVNLCILAFTAAEISKNDCDGIFVRDKYHEKEVLADNLDRPYLLVVDFHSNILYFSFSANPEDDVFLSHYINLNTKEFGNMTQIPNGFAQAVDQDRHEVYVGGNDGIYKFYYDIKSAERVGAEGINIWSMFYKDDLYYINFPRQVVYVLKNGESFEVENMRGRKTDFFIKDKDNYEFFKNESGLYGQTGNSQNATLYDETLVIRGLSTDVNGLPYVCSPDGIYFINKDSKVLEKIADIDECFGLAYDKDNNMIYSDSMQVVRLKLRAENKCSEEKNEGVAEDS